jgi:hypothetical protein
MVIGETTFVAGALTRTVRSVSLALACVLGATFGGHSTASADILSGTNPPLPGGISVTGGFDFWVASCPTGGGTCTLFPNTDTPTGPSNLSIDAQITFLQNNGFGTVTTDISGALQTNVPTPATVNTGGTAYSIWAIHNDSWYLALHYANPLNLFQVFNSFPNGEGVNISGIFAFNPTAVPLPPALVLFGTALAGMGILGRRRKQRSATQAI